MLIDAIVSANYTPGTDAIDRGRETPFCNSTLFGSSLLARSGTGAMFVNRRLRRGPIARSPFLLHLPRPQDCTVPPQITNPLPAVAPGQSRREPQRFFSRCMRSRVSIRPTVSGRVRGSTSSPKWRSSDPNPSAQIPEYSLFRFPNSGEGPAWARALLFDSDLERPNDRVAVARAAAATLCFRQSWQSRIRLPPDLVARRVTNASRIR